MGPDEIVATESVEPAPAAPAAADPAPSPALVPAEPAKPVSVRDSVRAAFDQLSKEPLTDEGKAAPPTKPLGQPPQRDPATGRFAAKPAAPGVAPGDGGERDPKQPAAASAKEPAAAAQVAGPPPGWSVASKAAWAALPEHIRADIAKREGEMNEGLAALRDFKDLKPYAEMARTSGTTLSAALQRYTTMEQLARRDPMQGLMTVAHNLGLTKQQAGQLFANLAAVLGVRPTNGPQTTGAQPSTSGSDQNDPLAEVIAPLIERALGPVANKLGALESHLSQRTQADQNARSKTVTDAIEKFAADPKNVYFHDLEETISRLFETGMVEMTGNPMGDLAKAYEMAAQLHPEVREALISERLKTKQDEARAKAAAAQKAAVSLNGHPAGGAAAPLRPAAGMSVRDSVRAAFDQLRSQV